MSDTLISYLFAGAFVICAVAILAYRKESKIKKEYYNSKEKIKSKRREK